jgi:hypothetical protein
MGRWTDGHSGRPINRKKEKLKSKEWNTEKKIYKELKKGIHTRELTRGRRTFD